MSEKKYLLTKGEIVMLNLLAMNVLALEDEDAEKAKRKQAEYDSMLEAHEHRERTCLPVRHDGTARSHGWWTCPECGGHVNGSRLCRSAYCQTCGIKLDWDEVER